MFKNDTLSNIFVQEDVIKAKLEEYSGAVEI